MKVAVLGKGLAGSFSALLFSSYAEVELIYDENIPSAPHGQGSFPNAPQILWDYFKYNFVNNPAKATIKTGINYKGWGKKHSQWFHPFNTGYLYAIHYDVYELPNYICNSGVFKVTNKHVTDYDTIDADWIIDCRGTPKSFEGYKDLKSPINSVILAQQYPADKNQLWTNAITTPNGWTFQIPLQDCMSLGYLYNSNITTYDEALDNFKEMFGEINNPKCINFKNYMVKKPVINKRVAFNGNRLCFIEPLEATACTTYIAWAEILVKSIFFRQFTIYDATTKINSLVKGTERFLLYHYMFGSKWKSKFWDYTETLFTEQDKNELTNILSNKRNCGVHGPTNITNWQNGMMQTELKKPE